MEISTASLPSPLSTSRLKTENEQNALEPIASKPDKQTQPRAFSVEVLDLRKLEDRPRQRWTRQKLETLDLKTQYALKTYLDTHLQANKTQHIDLYI